MPGCLRCCGGMTVLALVALGATLFGVDAWFGFLTGSKLATAQAPAEIEQKLHVCATDGVPALLRRAYGDCWLDGHNDGLHRHRLSLHESLPVEVRPTCATALRAAQLFPTGTRACAASRSSVEFELLELTVLAMDLPDRTGDRAVDNGFGLYHVLA
jgi:hypothetical protein